MGIQDNRWHVLVWPLDSSNPPTYLTVAIGGDRNEDPKFSFDGIRIVFKQDGNIRIADIAYGSTGTISVTSVMNVTTDGATTEERPDLHAYSKPAK